MTDPILAKKVEKLKEHLEQINQIYSDLQNDGFYIQIESEEKEGKRIWKTGSINQTIKY
jgi:hypothetical protein|tara:strand:- start:2372 stop:2548 length:177 start_codon:yes stop_codon:yes gene_type:complete